MIKTKSTFWRITVRLDPSLQPKVEKAAKAKRWSANDFIEEAVVRLLADHESK
jgi:predicted HicB family RNase H-like nuclease